MTKYYCEYSEFSLSDVMWLQLDFILSWFAILLIPQNCLLQMDFVLYWPYSPTCLKKKGKCSACSTLRGCILDVIQNFQVPDQQSADWLFCTFLSHGNCLKCLMLLRNTRSKLLEGQPVIFHCKKKDVGEFVKWKTYLSVHALLLWIM